MKVGDLIKNTNHPQAGIGIVVEMGVVDLRGEWDYVIAIFPEHGQQVAYYDEIEVIDESR